MKTKKLKLENLRVQSFMTEMKQEEQKTIEGGKRMYYIIPTEAGYESCKGSLDTVYNLC